jgi:hypothetical protein
VKHCEGAAVALFKATALTPYIQLAVYISIPRIRAKLPFLSRR